jgi:hypothetical protein
MLRKFVSAAVVVLLVAGVSLAQEKKADKKPTARPNVALGKVVSLDLKEGVGTITVMTRGRRGAEGKEMKFKVTKDTKFVKGASRDQKGTPVAADKVADTFKKDSAVVIIYEGTGDNLTAKTVNAGGPRRRRGQ